MLTCQCLWCSFVWCCQTGLAVSSLNAYWKLAEDKATIMGTLNEIKASVTTGANVGRSSGVSTSALSDSVSYPSKLEWNALTVAVSRSAITRCRSRSPRLSGRFRATGSQHDGTTPAVTRGREGRGPFVYGKYRDRYSSSCEPRSPQVCCNNVCTL